MSCGQSHRSSSRRHTPAAPIPHRSSMLSTWKVRSITVVHCRHRITKVFGLGLSVFISWHSGSGSRHEQERNVRQPPSTVLPCRGNPRRPGTLPATEKLFRGGRL